ncbi:NAD(P)/FAD-dependent oxidoreductase [Rathayibacter sp. AY1E4]|jgi:assimilatory nitrate reductase electron transfer subunit|uniref:NAD(P)/FAD-dependent oxidoreductase n=1 Tax=unclassified Rathayibacter TaxID=2609250 RepID=UPI000CE8DDD4|nr:MULTISPECIES: FAD-dependent oxidoreductase [unclassified Rathayibacter]PPF09740.1 NAD(P)/FAD-dependent oxidoreductase [Rathayibacter sp. AY1A5]PPH26922.1 NAD(P)/FAD-dependent oxidoreductase [Rathayibacter sp. AY1F9]PPH39325.1 NAD(P)/FAD-dependent oxidoreductase [Rathayibacter sp. AY1E4]PPH43343.1 NAD(P)/FAD-dependent oxidoreductase [Rathayibacter sp. AY1C9]
MPETPPERIVLIGYGPVGSRFVEELLPAVRAGLVALTVVGAESDDPYNRVLLAEYAVGRATRERLDLGDRTAAEAAGVVLRLGAAVVGIDRARNVVRLHDGERLPYDRLVLATGARANVPTLAGMERSRRERTVRAADPESLDAGSRPLPERVVALRDLADARVVRESVRSGARLVVLGAGVLGIEFALAAAEQGAQVVVVFHGDIPMARNLDTGGGRMLAAAARAAGVEMVAHARSESVLLAHDDRGRAHFQALVCADGKQIEGDLLVLSCGVGARVELAAGAELAVSTGILVDEQLRSWSDPDVFAIGDCAHVAPRGSALPDGRVPGGPSGLIGPGWEQADRLAARIRAEAEGRCGEERVPDARPAVVMLKAEGVDLVAGGDVAPEPWDPHRPGEEHLEVTLWADPSRGGYAKLVTAGGVLRGFVSVGLPRVGAELSLLFERGSELPADRSSLLRLDAPDAGAAATGDPFAPDATVCWCNGVTAAVITDAAAAGHGTVACVGRATRAGTGCGGCTGRIAELLARTAVPA